MSNINNTYRKDSIEFLDIAKGIGILLVVLGHAITIDLSKNYIILYLFRLLIYGIHMPLFFVIAGYLFEIKKDKYYKLGFKNFIEKKIIRFIIPYLMFSFIVYFIVFIVKLVPKIYKLFIKFGYKFDTINQVLYSILTYEKHIDKHLWFCYVMFIVLLISFFVNKYMNNKKRIIISLIILFFIYLITSIIPLPEIVWKTFKYLFIFNIGCRIRFIEYFSSFEKKGKITILLTLVTYICYVLTKFSNIGIAKILIQPIFEIFGVLSILIISRWISRYRYKLKLIFLYLGKRSYVIYLLHQPFIVSGITGVISIVFSRSLQIILIPLVTIIGIIIPSILYTSIISKSKLLKLLLLGDAELLNKPIKIISNSMNK